MIVDSSAVIAILRKELGYEGLLARLGSEPSSAMSAATFLETAIVIDATRDPKASRDLDDFCREADIRLIPFDEEQARIARQAYRDFGKGSGHKAKLNLGDCFAYALAKATGEPLLYKGQDFVHAGVASALK